MIAVHILKSLVAECLATPCYVVGEYVEKNISSNSILHFSDGVLVISLCTDIVKGWMSDIVTTPNVKRTASRILLNLVEPLTRLHIKIRAVECVNLLYFCSAFSVEILVLVSGHNKVYQLAPCSRSGEIGGQVISFDGYKTPYQSVVAMQVKLPENTVQEGADRLDAKQSVKFVAIVVG